MYKCRQFTLEDLRCSARAIMHIAVCLAPILDPKLPRDRLAIAENGRDVRRGGQPRKLGPFDEAALEVALKLRDIRSDARITALAIGDAEDEAAIRHAVALRVDAAIRLDIPDALRWDGGAVADTLAKAVRALEPGLVLIGREFGDHDDGVVPPSLAEALAWPFFGLAHEAAPADEGIALGRERGVFDERAVFSAPVVASITNHPRNRLRLPLLKNIMAANRQPIEVRPVAADVAADITARLRPITAEIARPVPRGALACRFVDGNAEGQAAELARFLEPWANRR
jgi:electron transfer flavoprotein beta subunit